MSQVLQTHGWVCSRIRPTFGEGCARPVRSASAEAWPGGVGPTRSSDNLPFIAREPNEGDLILFTGDAAVIPE